MASRAGMMACGVLLVPGLLAGCTALSTNPTATPVVRPNTRTATSPPTPPPSPYSPFPYDPLAQNPKAAPPAEPKPPDRPFQLPPGNLVTPKQDPPQTEADASPAKSSPEMKSVSTHSVLPVENPKPLPADTPLVTAVRHQQEGRPDQAVEDLKSYPPANQELLLGLLALAVHMTQANVEKANPREVSQLLDQLDSLEADLRARAPLTISHTCFCRQKPKGYGNYERWPGNEFRAGNGTAAGDVVFVYGELANPMVRRQGDRYVTNLASNLKIFDASGRQVLIVKEEATVRPTHVLVHDQYISYFFEVSPRMPPGPYTATLEVEDLTAQPHRVGRASLEFYLSPHGSDLTGHVTGGAGR